MNMEKEGLEKLSFTQKLAQRMSSNKLLRKLPFVDKFVQKQLNILPEAKEEKTVSSQREEFIGDLSNNGEYLNLSEKTGVSEHRKIYYEIGDKYYEIPMFELYIKHREESGKPIKLKQKEDCKYVIAFDEMNQEEKYDILKEVLDKSLTYTSVLTNQMYEDEPNSDLKEQKIQGLYSLCRTSGITDYIANKLYSENKIEEANNKLDKKIQEVLEFYQSLSENEKGMEL